MIPYGKHYIDEDDIQAVVDVLRGGLLTQGPKITEFENAFSHYVGSKYAVAVSSCTAGLHLAAVAAGLRPGDTLITSPITFVASANAGLYAGGNVAFADINPFTVNMDPAALAASLEDNPRTKVVVPVHFAGLPCEMESIKNICDRAGAVVIEDAAHALGATYNNGKRVGSCCYSLMTVFSLHPVKTIAAGEGGIITTNDESTYRLLMRLRSHGINKLDDRFIVKEQAFTDKASNLWYYEMQELGFHYRITDIQCALALSQLSKLDVFLKKRIEIAETYDAAFAGSEYIKPFQSRMRLTSGNHIYPIRIEFDKIGLSRQKLMQRLKDCGIGTQVHYLPVPMHPYYMQRGHTMVHLPQAAEYYSNTLTIPLFYSLLDSDQDLVIDQLNHILDCLIEKEVRK
jgi:perosamine synthetase